MNMLTDYSVHCPYEDCRWRGCLFPQGNRDDYRPAMPVRREITFLGPRCEREGQARIVGEDAVNLPLAEAVVQQA
jgi:hypothetical protein